MRKELVALSLITIMACGLAGATSGPEGVVRLSNAVDTSQALQDGTAARVDKIVTPVGIKTIDYMAGEASYERSYARVKLGRHTVIVQWNKGHQPAVYKLGPRHGSTELVTYIGSQQREQRSVKDVLRLAVTLKATVIDSPDRDGSKLVIFAKSRINEGSPEIYYVGVSAQRTQKLELWDLAAVTYKALI